MKRGKDTKIVKHATSIDEVNTQIIYKIRCNFNFNKSFRAAAISSIISRSPKRSQAWHDSPDRGREGRREEENGKRRRAILLFLFELHLLLWLGSGRNKKKNFNYHQTAIYQRNEGLAPLCPTFIPHSPTFLFHAQTVPNIYTSL